MSLSPGSRLGPYEIVGPLGAGGMGEVYRARDTRLDRAVAIKILAASLSEDPRFKERFEREARIIASLNHPHICTLHDIGEHGGASFLVMEHLEGETLAARLRRGRVPLDTVLSWAVQIADALELAHAKGIVHRDLKPANVFVITSGAVKVLDFGLAKLADRAPNPGAATLAVTEVGTAMGTVAYMSPEQARGGLLDARSDVFSLGAVLYEMATSEAAFAGPTTAVIFEAILSRPVHSMRDVAADLPPEFASVVERMLAKRPADRYSNGGAVAAALRAVRRNSETRARAAMDPMAGRKSIVVLPFADISAARDKEYFADGLTDEIITDLSRIQTMRVISRNSSMQLKGASRDLTAIVRDLRVQYVLEGTVRTAADNLRVSAQLIDATNDELLWAEKYSGKLEDVFDIQEKISRQIVGALKMRLSPEEDRRLAERPLADVRAYECYHRAFPEIYAFTEEGLNRASILIQQGLAVAGDNESLYGAMGTVYWQYVNAAINPDEAYLNKAEECARKAFSLNPESATGHLVLGLVQLTRGHRRQAIASLNRTLSIQPNNPYAVGELQRIYNMAGQEAMARSLMDRLVALDPLTAIVHVARFATELFFGQPETFHDSTRRYLEATPDAAMLRLVYAISLAHRREYEEARAILDRAPEETIPTVSGRACVFLRHTLAGRRAEALACFSDQLKAAARMVEFWSWCLADCYALAGESDEALTWLENAVARGFVNYPFLSQRDVALQSLHGHPRFQALMQRVRDAWEHFETES